MIRFEHRAVPVVLAAILIDTIGFGIVIPVLPQLVTQLGRMDLADASRVAGWMLVVFAIGQFVSGPVLGALSDRYGRRPVLVTAMLAFATDYVIMAFAPTLAWLFAGRALAGIAGAVVGPAGAAVADVTPPDKRSTNFGLTGAAFGIGFILGPALGGLAAELGPRVPFLVAAGLAGLNALAMVLLLPETLTAEKRRPFRWKEAHVVGAFSPLFHAGNATPLIVAWLLWQLGGVVYPATWSFWAALRLGWDAREIGLSLAYVGLLTALVQTFLVSRLVSRMGEKWAAVTGLAAGGATLVAYAFATHGWQVYAFFLVGALGGIGWAAMSGIASRMVDETRQGALQGGLASLNSLAAIIGPFVFSHALALGAREGFAGLAFLLAGILTLVAGGIVAAFARHPRLA